MQPANERAQRPEPGHGPDSPPSLRAVFFDLRTAAAAYRQIPERVPLSAVGDVQRIVAARVDAETRFRAALTRRRVRAKSADKLAVWLVRRLTPSERHRSADPA